ncbi:acyl-CoA dehydrogenase [Seongchinamella sediminis]|uniref:Acyl-CoA dehydrogenase n=1 Tax=Seongchinamella sediminis TaxID=2283635 RepID=A0A3L7DSR7_9GAMM|nr:acyl-CoA dehydrogenase family protein [Seongchinamella sediminis]RLQ20568.1 acyl-CoA dehydrogenase [Seongchinamella sediminis]
MIPRTLFETEHEQFRDSVSKFLEAEAVPYHHQWEKDGQIDRALWQKAGAMGFLAPGTAENLGGLGLDFRYNAILDEETARRGLSGIGFGLHSDITVPYLLNIGNQAQLEKYIPGCLSGDIITAIAMTEPGTGSDLQSIKTTAIRDGDDYVINGSKTFITNGQLADLVIVVCKTDPSAGAAGTSLLLVEAGTPGFEKGKNLEKLGLKAQDTSELFFNDVRVPKENLLGEEGKGFIYLMQELPQERLSIAIGCTAGMESVLAGTVDYVQERQAFGQPIASFQNTQFKLAELDAEVTAMRVFVDRCIELHVAGKLDTVTASKAKLLSSELMNRVADECLQLHGGYGYMWEYPVARAYADSRINRIYGGTNEIMKLIIARKLLQS